MLMGFLKTLLVALQLGLASVRRSARNFISAANHMFKNICRPYLSILDFDVSCRDGSSIIKLHAMVRIHVPKQQDSNGRRELKCKRVTCVFVISGPLQFYGFWQLVYAL